ncbi:hypothetical protein FKW77_008931 [Venturia effusa]|uniref:Endopolyphosphatase n=1 Tax=Venturia effusa TaxID=50376 RepID=A0A517LG59_9PEZI|nr:hypothetical protein FKW77_008931 [Venturia effusa]
MRTGHYTALQSLLLHVLFATHLRLALALPQLHGASTSTSQTLSSNHPEPRRNLTGRFLHITDIHPDPFYKTYSSTSGDGACHRGHGPAGFYGAETSDCDSPITLLNATFTWIKENLRDEIDFVIWTGDSARHDNDEKIPRSERQVVEQNQLVVEKFREVFGKSDDRHDDDPTNDFIIPIIPTFGNNDILPHNIFTEGPNRWTKRYLDIWRQFIPEEQRHAFQSGGWFYVEAIRNELAVFSINTLYFFDSNSAVDGCAVKSEPGFEQFEWLRIQLQILRERGMKAILTGHVPPARVDSKASWDETCWQKYTLWMQQYRDVIVGSIYGHMNIDHFMLQDFKDVKKHIRDGFVLAEGTEKGRGDAELSIASATDYLVDLRHLFAKIPAIGSSLQIADGEPAQSWSDYFLSPFSISNKSKKKKGNSGLDKIGGEYAERYSMSFVSPSVVPNYFPTLRVFEYDVTGLNTADATPRYNTLKDTELVWADTPLSSYTQVVDAERKNKKKKQKKHKFTVPQPPSKSSPPGPAYSPQSLSWLGYTQYFANLTYINNDFLGETSSEDEVSVGLDRWKEGHHHGKVKRGKPNPKKFKFEVEYDTFSDKIFGLKDLTLRSYLHLAQKIAKSKTGGKSVATEGDVPDQLANGLAEEEDDEHASGHRKKKRKKKDRNHLNKVWYAFVRRAFVNTMNPTDVKEQFGKQQVPIAETIASLEL